MRDVACNSNSPLVIDSRRHFDNSAHVLVRSWCCVFAVTVPRVNGDVDIAQSRTIAPKLVFPTPLAAPMLIRIGSLRPGVRNALPSESRTVHCQSSGLSHPSKSRSPHG